MAISYRNLVKNTNETITENFLSDENMDSLVETLSEEQIAVIEGLDDSEIVNYLSERGDIRDGIRHGAITGAAIGAATGTVVGATAGAAVGGVIGGAVGGVAGAAETVTRAGRAIRRAIIRKKPETEVKA